MFSPLRHVLAILASLAAIGILTAIARGAISGTLAEGGPRGDWAMLTLEFPRLTAAAEIHLRDVRGGMEVIRPLPAGTSRTTLSMPLIAPAQLADAQWALDVTLRDGGTILERALLRIPLTPSQQLFRIAMPAGTSRDIMAKLPREPLTQGSLSFVEMSEEDFVAAPAVLFAGCDAILLTPAIRNKLSDERILSLLAAGVQLILPADALAARALSPALAWQAAGELATAWVAPPVPLRRPAIVVPNLSRVSLPSVVPDGGVRGALLLVGPAAIIAALIARGLFKSSLAIHLAVAGAMIAVPVAVIAFISQRDEPVKTGFHIREAATGVAGPGGGAMLDQHYFARGTLLPGAFDFQATDGSILLPQYGSASAFFAAAPVRLTLLDTLRLQGEQPARSMYWFAELSALPLPELAPSADGESLVRVLSVDPGRAWRVAGGYFTSVQAASDAAAGLLTAAWADKRSPSIARAARAWEVLRLQGSRRYLVWESDATETLSVLDLGAMKGVQ